MAARMFEGSIAYSRVGTCLMAILITAVWSLATYAQCAPTPLCPAVSVDGPTGLPEKDKPWSFRASLSPDTGSSDLEFWWTITFGEIVGGQGSRELLVRVPHDKSFSMTATLTVRDRRIGCHASDSASGHVKGPPPPRRLLVDLSGKSTKIPTELLRKVVDETNGDPTARLYIIIGRKRHEDLTATEKLIRSTLAGKLKRPEQITFLTSAQKVDRITFWIVPAGATPPSDHQ